MRSLWNLTSLTNLKNAIDKSNTTDDAVLERLIMRSSADIDAHCNRKLRARNYGANGIDPEYQNGTGSKYLRTKQYPLISITNLYDDLNRDFGSATLKASTDYFVHNAAAGIIQLEADAALGSVFSEGNGNIRLEYIGGFDHFYVIDDQNDRLDFEETASTELTANIAGDVYTASGLCTQLETALDAAGASTHTATYDYYTSKFKIASDRTGGGGTFKLLWNSGTNAYRTIGNVLGFDLSADDADAADHTSDYSALGIPDDLEDACLWLCQDRLEKAQYGGKRFGIDSRVSEQQAGTLKFIVGEIPPEIKRMLRPYKRVPLI